MAPEAPNVSARETKWLRRTSATLNPSTAMNFQNHHAGTARRIQHPEKLKTTCWQGMRVFRSWCPACVQGQGRADGHRGKGHKELEYGSKIPRCGIADSLRPRIEPTRFEVEQRGDSPVLVMHDGVTKSIFAQLIPAKRVDFASCENVLKMMIADLDNLGWCFGATMSPPFLHYSGR